MPDDREQKIRARAYELWEAAGRPEGREKEHWDEAQRLVDAEAAAPGEAKPRKPRRKAPAGVKTPPLEKEIPPQKPRRTPTKRSTR